MTARPIIEVIPKTMSASTKLKPFWLPGKFITRPFKIVIGSSSIFQLMLTDALSAHVSVQMSNIQEAPQFCNAHS
ncbi:hypothetical protein D3C87_1407390 [compost metagenome]